MKIIHETGYTKEECLQYRAVVYSNTIQSLMAIIRAMPQLGITFHNKQQGETTAKKFIHMLNDIEDGEMTQELAKLMKSLWNDQAIQTCFQRSAEYQLNDSAAYYLNALDRISQVRTCLSVYLSDIESNILI